MKEKVIYYLKTNRLMITYVLLGLLFTFLFRSITVKNIFYIKPILSDLAFLLFTGAFAYFMKPEKRIYYFIMWSLFISFLLIGNAIYYRFYSQFLSLSLLSQASQMGDVKDSIFELIHPIDFIFIAYPFLLLVLFLRLRRTNYFEEIKIIQHPRTIRRKTFATSIILLLVFALSLSGLEVSRLYKQWNRTYLVERLGLYTYQIADAVKTISSKMQNTADLDQALLDFNAYYNNPKQPIKWNKNNYTNKLKGRNVIFIHYESAMNFAVNLKVNNIEITPNLNRLASEGIYFNNFYAQESVGTSSDTEFTVNTSLMPLNQGTVFINYAGNTYSAIPGILAKKGYQTYSMHGNEGGFWNRTIMHKQLGYQEFFDKKTFEINEEIGLGLSDVSFYKQAVEKLKDVHSKSKKPFMATLITLTNHAPFEYNELFGDVDLGYMNNTKLGDYLVSLHYADYALGTFIEQMDKAGLLQNTVIVLYGDHDARINTNEFKRLYNYDETTDQLYDTNDERYVDLSGYAEKELKRVPAFIWTKDHKFKPQVVNKPMGMIDLGPTVLNMLGAFNYYAIGKDIFSNQDPFVMFPDTSWLDEKVYYNANKEEYYPLSETESLNPSWLKVRNEQVNDLYRVSEYTIFHNLIKYDLEQKELLKKRK